MLLSGAFAGGVGGEKTGSEDGIGDTGSGTVIVADTFNMAGGVFCGSSHERVLAGGGCPSPVGFERATTTAPEKMGEAICGGGPIALLFCGRVPVSVSALGPSGNASALLAGDMGGPSTASACGGNADGSLIGAGGGA